MSFAMALQAKQIAEKNFADVSDTVGKTDWVDVRRYGAIGNDETVDDSIGIQIALAMAEKGRRKEVVIPDGQYRIGRTLIVPPRVHLVMGKDTVLIPIKDVNVIQLKPEARLSSGIVDTRRFQGRTFTDFTKACVYLDGTDVFSLYNQLHQINGIMLIGEDHYYTDQNWTGYGIHMYSGKGSNGTPSYISFVNMSQIGIFNFQRGIYMDVDDTIKNNSEWAWITGCTFNQINMMNCTWSIYMKGLGGIPRDVGGNIFTNLEIQIEPTSQRAIYCEGAYNRFEGLFWDLQKNPNPSIEFASTSRFNTVVCAHGYEQPQHFLDNGYLNTISSSTNHVPDKRTLAYPLAMPDKPNFLGNQDDFLVRGDLRGYTFTQTSSHLPQDTWASMNELLTMETEVGYTWKADNATYENPIIFELNMTSDPVWYLAFAGLTSAWNTSPKGVRIEGWDALSNQWIFLHEVNNNSSFPYVVSAPWAMVSKCTKLRYSLWGTNDPKGKLIQISRIFAQSCKYEGKAWFPRAGGNMEGELTTAGGLVLEKRTDDPPSPKEGRIWYRSDSSLYPVRVATATGIRALQLTTIVNEYLNIGSAVKNGGTAVIAENTADFFRITCNNNGDGLIIPTQPLKIGKNYNINVDVEIINNVDDVVQLRIYNRTKAAYINTNLAVSTATKGGIQKLSKSFTLTSTNFTEGDAVEIWVAQFWKNNTHDAFEYKVYKNNLGLV